MKERKEHWHALSWFVGLGLVGLWVDDPAFTWFGFVLAAYLFVYDLGYQRCRRDYCLDLRERRRRSG